MKPKPISTPLLMGGDVLGPFKRKIPQGECPQGWMLRRPAEVEELLGAFSKAGVECLCAPTQGLNSLSLAAADHADQSRELIEGMVDLARKASGHLGKVAGVIVPVGEHAEPFGPLPFIDLIDTYAEQALELAAAGVTSIVIQGMEGLADARAAVLGARQSSLPILVSFLVDHNGRMTGDRDVLASLICLQELGIAAFGVECDEAYNLPQTLKRLAPYSKVPLLAVVQAGDHEPEDIQRPCFELLASGARILMGGKGTTPDHMSSIKQMMSRFQYDAFSIEPLSESPLLLADENRVHYLEEDFSTSEEIDCAMDMSEAILDSEDQGVDSLVMHVQTVDDAYHLGQNTHMASIAVSILARTEEALEMALLYYNGRAIIDSRSDVEPEVLQTLAQGYGAVVR